MNVGEQRRLAILSTPSEVRQLADFCRSSISGLFPDEDVASIELALVEAANNIVEHAYNFDASQPLQLSIFHRGDHIELLFFDRGPAFDYGKIMRPDFEWDKFDDIPEGGWGIFLIDSIMDSVERDRQGNINILKMTRKLPPEKVQATSIFLQNAAATLKSPENDARISDLEAKVSENEIALREMAEELSSAYESLNLFYSLSRDVALISSLNEFLDNTLARVLSIAGASWGIVRLRDDGRLKLLVSSSGCPEAAMIKQIAISNPMTIEGKVALSLKAELLEAYPGTKDQAICLPIVGLDEFLGTILLGKSGNSTTFSSGDVKLARAMADQIAVSIENNRLYKQAMDAELDKQEIQIATDLQKKIMLRNMPETEGLEFYTRTETAKQVGGDYLTIERVSDSVFFLIVCDAMGKGMSASYFSLLSHMAIHSVLLQQKSTEITPGELLSLVNRVMFRDFELFGMFMTGFVGRIDIRERLMSYASAGHSPPILYTPGEGVRLLETADFMMGVDSCCRYKDFSLDLCPGMKFFAYSDGLTDITGRDGNVFGTGQLMELCGKYFADNAIGTACERIYESILDFSGGQIQDDISIMGVERSDDKA
ncbi:MAG: SpoIIE family protein phosphatase [Victivallales bacterium]|nr:SpoIIE family protein phosphatase [Victivallales bacterium]